jgi:hypothetical protein
MGRIIFYLPFKIDKNRYSASQIRPTKLLATFCALGYEVDLIEGCGSGRKKAIKAIKQKIKSGIKYDFLYSESSTMPTLLTEKHHFPIYPFLDFRFFSFCKKYGIKIGLFYRDIYWCFSSCGVSVKLKIAHWFYKYDLRKYNELIDVLFIPSLEMLSYLPYKMNVKTVSLPSGCIVHEKKIKGDAILSTIELLYVGGIGQHYDLTMLLKVVGKISHIHFTLCCRKEDWILVKSIYEPYLGNNVTITHKSGNELNDLYEKADLFNLFIEPNEYRKFAVPFKLFEAIGWKCPILASKGTWVANYVESHHIGIVCEYDENLLYEFLSNIFSNDLDSYKQKLETFADSQSWQHRCVEIAQLLQ